MNEYADLKEKISLGREFKQHLDIAMSMKDDDSVLNHLTGRFYFEILSLSWIQRKLANAFAGTSKEVSYQNAVQYFHRAYELNPLWIENILYLVKCNIALGHFESAQIFLEKGLIIPVKNEMDSLAHDKLLELQKLKK